MPSSAHPYKPRKPVKPGKTSAASINKALNAAAETAAAPATTTTFGLVKKGAVVANAAGANPTKAEFDALLASLRTAGVIATA